MSDIGFAIFGRPDGQEVLSNGLFVESKLSDSLYLGGLTDGVVLEKGESVAVIRQVEQSSKNIIIWIAVFEYAESFGGTNRAGGFVGAAVCFRKFPHMQLIQRGLFSLMGTARGLIDSETKKFKSQSKESWNLNLPEPDNKWTVEPPKTQNQPVKAGSRLVVAIEGPLQLHLPSVFQGLYTNPVYNSIHTCIVSSSKGFLDRMKTKGGQIVSPFELLDYSSFHAHYNQKLDEIRARGIKENEALKTSSLEVTAKKNELNILESNQARLKKDFEILNAQFSELEVKYRSGTEQLKALQHKTEQISNNIKRSFEKDVINGPYGEQLQRFVLDKERAAIKREKTQLQNESKKESSKFYRIHKALAHDLLKVFALIILVISVVSIPLYFFDVWPFQRTVVKVEVPAPSDKTNGKETIDLIEKSEDLALGSSSIPLEAFSPQEFLHLPKNQKETHNRNIETYIDTIADIFLKNKSSTELRFFINRQWNIVDLFDPNKKENKDRSLVFTRLNKVEKLFGEIGGNNQFSFGCWQGCGKAVTNPIDSDGLVDEWYQESLFLIHFGEKKQQFKLDSILNFDNTDRKKILKTYLSDDRNIYKTGEIPFDKDSPSLYIRDHFRWMVFELNKDSFGESEADLVSSSKKSFKLPILKDDN